MHGMPARLPVMVKISERYIATGSSTFSPILNAGNGETGATIASTCSNASRVIARDQRPDLLRLQIIRVVIARAQHVRSQHDPALALGAESFAARLAIHVASASLPIAARAV